jgi:hypothetical protein
VRWWSRRHTTYILVATVVVLVNIVQFPLIERAQNPANFRAIYRPGTADLAKLMYLGCAPACVERYGLAVALGRIAPGARVIIPEPSPLLADRDWIEESLVRLRAFGAVETIDAVAGDSVAPALDTFDAAPYVIATGSGGAFEGAWAIAVDPSLNPAPRVGPGQFLHHVVFDDVHAGRDGRRREFVYFRRGTVDLLVEVSLLPSHVAAELRS